MAVDTRQNTLLSSTVWQKIYRTFSETDFKSYDFDTIRRTLIDYLQINYPESYNDYIDSSEFVALIDLIAYVGQSISYRVDLNARENFIDLAERKESVLRLARLISYQPKRNIPASGFLKVDSVITTESVFDSNGSDLSNTPILWNDVTNANWQEQFNAVMNAALSKEQFIGKPQASETIAGVPTEMYRLNASNVSEPLYGFTRNISGINMPFEIVPCSFLNEKFIYEESPIPGNSLSFIYKNDSQGFGSANTGFFLHFRQGSIGFQDFTVTNSSPNTIVSINQSNINNSDVWLFGLDSNGVIENRWTKVPAITGNNVIYNSLEGNVNNQYAVTTRPNDQISLVFSDGTYGNLPKGNFKCVFRTSNNLTYSIQKASFSNISIDVEYISRSGQLNTLTFNLSLQSTVTNASATQSTRDIKTLAPQSYYTNNRMISPEDYQITPLVENPSIAKVKSQVRTSSGISRFLDVVDPSGVYSQTDTFADDGILYREEKNSTFDFQFANNNDVQNMINTTLTDVLKSSSFRHFYYRKYPALTVPSKTWNRSTISTNSSTGYFQEGTTPKAVGASSSSNLKYVTADALVKFNAPSGSHFMANGTLMTGTADHPGSSSHIWSKIVSVEGDGSNVGTGNLGDGTGPIQLNENIPSTSELGSIIPKFVTSVSTTLANTIVDNVKQFKNFALSYNYLTATWNVIDEDNLNTGDFDLANQGSTANTQSDASWMIRFLTNGVSYTVYYRTTKYIFQSKSKNKFYFDESVKIYDTETGKTVKDKIQVLKTNTGPDLSSILQHDVDWQIVGNVIGTDGYNETRKMEVGFFDSDDDGIVDDPDIFDDVIGELTSRNYKYVFFQAVERNGFEEQDPVLNSEFVVSNKEEDITNLSVYVNGQKFYFYSTDTFKKYNSTTSLLESMTGYTAFVGRDSLYYRYNHGAPRSRRIDPAVSNMIDVYVMTRTYDAEFRTWLRKAQSTTKPTPPTIASLNETYGPSLDALKSVSDQIIFNPGQYKLLFGPGAANELQALFKVVKNPQTSVSDNQLKSSVIEAIDLYFNLGLWDFGDKFYFSELAAFVHNQLSPDVLSVVIVPSQASSGFGSLFQINSAENEILISSATVDNVEMITSITAEKLKATGTVVVSSGTTSTTSTSTVSSTATASSTSTSSSSSSGSSGGYY